jgi:hypothetical protein
MGGVCAKGAKAGATVSPAPQREPEQGTRALTRAPPAGNKSKRRGSVRHDGKASGDGLR